MSVAEPGGVTRLGVADAGELLTLQRAAWVQEGRANATFEIPPLTETLEDVRAALLDAGTSILGLREDGRLLATVRTTVGEEGWAYLGRLGVVPDLQGRGLGDAMLRAAEDDLSAGVTRLWLIAGAKSTANHAFYARRGWRLDPEPMTHPGIVRMVKQLG